MAGQTGGVVPILERGLMAGPQAPEPFQETRHAHHFPRTAGTATPLPLGAHAARADCAGAAPGPGRCAGADVVTSGRPGTPHGRTLAGPGLGERLQGGHPVQKLRLVADERPGHLDGGPCLGAAIPHAGPGHAGAHPAAQRGTRLLYWQAGRVGAHGAGRTHRPALHQLPPVATRCQQAMQCLGCHLHPHRTAGGRTHPARRRPGHAHLHLGHHRRAQGCDAQLWQLCLGHRAGAAAHSHGAIRPAVVLPAPGPCGRAPADRTRLAANGLQGVLR